MKRQAYLAVVTDESGRDKVGERQAYAWNSAIRVSESIVREYGREHGYMLEGGAVEYSHGCEHGKFCHCSSYYHRKWTAPDGHVLCVGVWERV